MEYFEPNFLNEALVVLDRYGSRARVLAGGTLLGPDVRTAPASVDALVNVKRISGLTDVELEGSTLRIGALATAHALATHPLVRQFAPLVAEAAASLGARQLRSVATIGGNVCSGHHSADLSVALLASDARLVHENLREGRSRLPIERFFSPGFQGFGSGVLITAIEISVLGGECAYVKMQTRRAFEMALVSAAALVRRDGDVVTDARLALGGAAPTPILAVGAAGVLVGSPLTRALARRAAKVAAEIDAEPRDGSRASAEYRRHLVRIMTERALLGILERREGNGR